MSGWMYIQCLGHFYVVLGRVGDPKKNETTECIGNRGAGKLQGVEKWGWKTSEERHPVGQSFPHGTQQLAPTCISRGALGLECQNIVTKRDLDFHCCRLEEFYDIQDNHKQCCQNSKKLLGVYLFFHNLMPGERGT